MNAAVWIGVLFAGLIAVQLVLWAAVRVWFRRRRRAVVTELMSEIAAETAIRVPEPASYRGATAAGYSAVNNDGVLALTRGRIVFRALTGRVIEVPVDGITGVREADAFRTATRTGRPLLIVETSTGDIAFDVGDRPAWIASLETVGVRQDPHRDATATRLRDLNAGVLSVARRSRRRKMIVAAVFTSIGLASGLAAGASAAVIAQSVSGERYVDGTVVSFSRDGSGEMPVVEFMPANGETVRFTGAVGSNPSEFKIGEQVRVRYNPDDPRDATIDRYWQTWSVPTWLAIFGAPFLLGGIAFGVLALRTPRPDDTALQLNSSQ